MLIAHNGTCTMHCDVLADIRVAREAGYAGIEIIGSKLYAYLDGGGNEGDVLKALGEFPVVGVGYVQDIERQASDAREALLAECERMCAVAARLGSPLVQLLTGPIDAGLGLEAPVGYRGLMQMPWSELRSQAAANLAELASIGARHGVSFYLEPLSWTRIHTLEHGRELIDTAGCDNVRLLIDFWHCFTSGTTPDDIAKLDRDLIAGIHYCDSLHGDRSSHADRDVWTGGGLIPQKEWVDAVVGTGFEGWWACELFSERHWELDARTTARLLRRQLEYLLV